MNETIPVPKQILEQAYRFIGMHWFNESLRCRECGRGLTYGCLHNCGLENLVKQLEELLRKIGS